MPHGLVQAVVVEDAIALLVDVDAVRTARSVAVEQDTERDRLTRVARENEMRVARVEAEGDAAVRPFKRDLLRAGRPLAGEPPLIQSQTLKRRLAPTACVTEIRLRRAQVVAVCFRLHADGFDDGEVARDPAQWLDASLRLV